MSTLEKARKINSLKKIYGTFAEIGAGQETARFFFQAGGASATITKTMSAYDMIFSDAIYGPEESGRYVCEPRLQKMLSREFDLIIERLEGRRKDPTCFFSFANTVATGSFSNRSPGHGWVGVRFQTSPGSYPSEVRIHVRMTDNQAVAQQETLGVVGVNLIFASLFYLNDPISFIRSLKDDLEEGRLEVDAIRFAGPAFEGLDNRIMEIELVRENLAQAVIFDHCGEPTSPSDYLYRKHILALRGHFRPITLTTKQMMDAGVASLKASEGVDPGRVLALAEISMFELTQDGRFDPFDFLARVDMLASIGLPTLVTSLQDDYSLVEYLHQYSSCKRALVQGTHKLKTFFSSESYKHVNGGILEALGRMLSHGTKQYFYPIHTDQGALRLEDIALDSKTGHLVNYLREGGGIEEIPPGEETAKYLSPDQVLKMIEALSKGWETHVPPSVAQIIMDRSLFGLGSKFENSKSQKRP